MTPHSFPAHAIDLPGQAALSAAMGLRGPLVRCRPYRRQTRPSLKVLLPVLDEIQATHEVPLHVH